MMRLLVPLGLLGLLGIVALIVIYIIKPNYQVRHIPSTYIWKLSLRYRKRRLPTSRVRNILLFLCQILILVSMAFILAQPAIVHANETGELDIVAVIDSSASMYAGSGAGTRFDRAVESAQELSEETLRQGGNVSVILADAKPRFLARRVSQKSGQLLRDEFDALESGDTPCSYGVSDIGEALTLAEDVLAENPSAKVYLYTDTQYSYVPEGITVVSVAETGEWNAAVLGATSELVDGYYSVSVEIACYGNNKEVEVCLEVMGVNAQDPSASGNKVSVRQSVFCDSDAVKTVIFCDGGGADTENVTYYDLGGSYRFSGYQSIHVSVDADEDDSFLIDNDFYLYDGQKEMVKVLYASTDPNPFFTSALDYLKLLFADRWKLDVEEVPKGKPFPSEGYDFYIYEHKMPDTLPVDGAVLLADPNIAPVGSGLQLRSVEDKHGTLTPCDGMVAHTVTQYLIPENIKFSRYTVFDFEAGYEALLSIGADPLLLVQNDKNIKIAVLPFSVHYSNIALQPEWVVLLYNIFDYFLPSTVSGTAFEVGEEFVLNGRGPRVTYSDTEDPIEEFPATLKFSVPGTYTLRQELYFTEKDPVSINLFVRIPRGESDLWAVEDGLEDPYKEKYTGESYNDLLVILAAILFSLVFLEWLLNAREGR